MKILYYSPHPGLNLQSLSGYGTHMREMINAFEKQGCEVLPVIMGGAQQPEERTLPDSKNGVKDLIKKVAGKRAWRTLKDIDLIRFDHSAKKQLDETVQKFKPDFIYERANYIQLSGVEVGKHRSVPHVLEVNGPYVEETDVLSNTKSLIKKRISARDREQLLKTDFVITVSEALKDYFIDLYKVPESKFLVLPNAFNTASIKTDHNNQDNIQKKYNLKGKTIIGFVGSIFKWHNLDNLIRSFSELENQDTKLLIVGFGEYVKELQNIAAKSHRNDDIIFTGKVSKDEVFDYIEVMDICVAPGAAWYQSPIKIFEYGAMGKPVLGPKTGPVQEVIEDGKDGFLVEKNAHSLKAILDSMIGDQEKCQNVGETFKQKVLTQFTWENNADKILKKISDFKSQ